MAWCILSNFRLPHTPTFPIDKAPILKGGEKQGGRWRGGGFIKEMEEVMVMVILDNCREKFSINKMAMLSG